MKGKGMILSILKIKNAATLVKGRGGGRLELVAVGFCAQKPTTTVHQDAGLGY